MIAVAFRFKASGWQGIAVARNKVELFWQIDEHGDPYSVEIINLQQGSMCATSDGEIEWCEELAGGKWKAPVWPEEIYKGK